MLLVERDETLAGRARSAAAALGVGRVDVRAADAARPASFADVLPVDLLLLCGIFGNVPDEDIRRTVAAVPLLLAPGGIVIWTRGRFDGPDLRPAVRAWFREAGLTEVAYDEEAEGYGVGVAQRRGRRAERGGDPRSALHLRPLSLSAVAGDARRARAPGAGARGGGSPCETCASASRSPLLHRGRGAPRRGRGAGAPGSKRASTSRGGVSRSRRWTPARSVSRPEEPVRAHRLRDDERPLLVPPERPLAPARATRGP